MNFRYSLTLARTRFGIVLGVGAAMLSIGGFSYASGERTRVVEPPNAAALETLRQKTIEFAARNGEPNPTRLRLVTGTRVKVVERLMGGSIVDSDQDVFAIAMEGNFIGYTATRSPRYPEPPRGKYMLIVYDAATLKAWDWSLTTQPAPIELLSPVLPVDNQKFRKHRLTAERVASTSSPFHLILSSSIFVLRANAN